ncbi:MAG: hypothetical protein JXA33_13355 [Anaerolineae bacterium]|nr:hypothetical protein [Anaerolineae bacterium]
MLLRNSKLVDILRLQTHTRLSGEAVSCGWKPASTRVGEIQADAAIAAAIGGETRTTTLAVEGTTPHPPRR